MAPKNPPGPPMTLGNALGVHPHQPGREFPDKRIRGEPEPSRQSLNVRHNVRFSGKNRTITLEDAFWSAFKEISAAKNTSRPVLVQEIDQKRQHANLSSAMRLFVLDYYRKRAG